MRAGTSIGNSDDYNSGMEEVRFYGWEGDPLGAPSFTVPMYWVRIQSSSTPEQLAQWATNALSKRGQRDRVIHIWKPMDGVFNRNEMVKMIVEGPYIEPLRTRYFEFYKALKSKGINPYRVVCDYEDGLTLWNWEETAKLEMLESVYSNKQCVQLLPVELQTVPLDYYKAGHPQRSNVHDMWHSWSLTMRAEAMRKVILEPQQHYFGGDTKLTNYSDCWRDFPTDTQISSNNTFSYGVTGESAPVLYILNKGSSSHRLPTLVRQTGIHWRWITFLDKINLLRSNLNSGGCSPWISPVGYQREHDKWNRDTPWLDAQLAGHAILAGCHDFHYWNPGPPTQFPDASLRESIDAYSSIIQEVEPYRRPVEDKWVKIEVSAESIPLRVETCGFVTTYEDYLRFKNPAV